MHSFFNLNEQFRTLVVKTTYVHRFFKTLVFYNILFVKQSMFHCFLYWVRVYIVQNSSGSNLGFGG